MPEPVGAARPDLTPPRRVHVIGAGGAGMSAIAAVLLANGNRVSGSDAADSPALRRLARLGADVHAGHAAERVRGADVVVRSTAVGDANPEVEQARSDGLVVWRRADVLAALCALRRTVAVSGTHGKTTTSSMLAVILREAGLHPSMVIGGEIAAVGPGAAWDPAGEWLVVEADESDATFVALGAEVVVVTSVEADHLEFYGGLAGLEAAFERFVSDAPGPAIVCADDPGARRLAGARRRGQSTAITYGTAPGADFAISGVQLARDTTRFALRSPGGLTGEVELAVPGLHNARNAAGAIAAAVAAGTAWEDALGGAGRYQGVARRFERRGEAGGVSFVDGYDHLPGEVAAALATARAGGWNRVVAVFQPHRYSRTQALWRELAGALAAADLVVVTGIYPAGEPPRPGVSARLVFDALREAAPGTAAYYAETLGEATELLAPMLEPGDVCLTLGAGDVTTLPDRLMAILGAGRDG